MRESVVCVLQSASAQGLSVAGNQAVTVLSGGNVGIGVTAPRAQLHLVSGNVGSGLDSEADNLLIMENGNGGITIVTAADGFGNIFFGDSSNRKEGEIIFDQANEMMQFKANETEILNLKSGNIGIGTTNPERLLHIVGANPRLVVGDDITYSGSPRNYIAVNDSDGDSFSYFGQVAGRAGGIGWKYNATTTNAYAWLYTLGYNNDIRADGKNILLQTISGGNVGIGTTNPEGALYIAASISDQSVPDVDIEDNNNAQQRHQVRIANRTNYSNSNRNFYDPTGMPYNASANILIDTLVNTTGDDDRSYAGITFLTGQNNGRMSGALGVVDDGGSYGAAGGMYFGTRRASNIEEAMRIDSAGNVGIGTTNPIAKLHVWTGASNNVLIGNDGGNIELSKTTGSYIDFKNSDADDRDSRIQLKSGQGLTFEVGGNGSIAVDAVVISGNGNVGIGTVAPDEKFEVRGGAIALGDANENSLRPLVDELAFSFGTGDFSSTQNVVTMNFQDSYFGAMIEVMFYITRGNGPIGQGYGKWLVRQAGGTMSQTAITDVISSAGSPVRMAVEQGEGTSGTYNPVRIEVWTSGMDSTDYGGCWVKVVGLGGDDGYGGVIFDDWWEK